MPNDKDKCGISVANYMPTYWQHHCPGKSINYVVKVCRTLRTQQQLACAVKPKLIFLWFVSYSTTDRCQTGCGNWLETGADDDVIISLWNTVCGGVGMEGKNYTYIFFWKQYWLFHKYNRAGGVNGIKLRCSSFWSDAVKKESIPAKPPFMFEFSQCVINKELQRHETFDYLMRPYCIYWWLNVFKVTISNKRTSFYSIHSFCQHFYIPGQVNVCVIVSAQVPAPF